MVGESLNISLVLTQRERILRLAVEESVVLDVDMLKFELSVGIRLAVKPRKRVFRIVKSVLVTAHNGVAPDADVLVVAVLVEIIVHDVHILHALAQPDVAANFSRVVVLELAVGDVHILAPVQEHVGEVEILRIHSHVEHLERARLVHLEEHRADIGVIPSLVQICVLNISQIESHTESDVRNHNVGGTTMLILNIENGIIVGVGVAFVPVCVFILLCVFLTLVVHHNSGDILAGTVPRTGTLNHHFFIAFPKESLVVDNGVRRLSGKIMGGKFQFC